MARNVEVKAEDANEGIVEANALMAELGVNPDTLIEEAYVELLLSRP